MLEDLLLEVLHISTDTSQNSHVYLLVDGLELWISFLDATPSPPPQNAPPVYGRLLQLYRNLLPSLDTSTENLQLCIQITISYIVLCPLQFLQT